MSLDRTFAKDLKVKKSIKHTPSPLLARACFVYSPNLRTQYRNSRKNSFEDPKAHC